jgi:GDP-L-fucose synthase
MKVLVTGSHGFVGAAVLAELQRRQIPCVGAPRSGVCDLLKAGDVADLLHQTKPTAIIHCAAPWRGAGIRYQHSSPYTCTSAMLRMDALLIDHAIRAGVRTLVGLGTLHEYPERAHPVVLDERDLWDGAPEPVNGAYGHAKRMQLALLQAARQEHGLNGIHVILSNCYGPTSAFDAHAHVIPATIWKVDRALQEHAVELLASGDGDARREFLYLEDAARGIVDALERYDDPLPVTLCSGADLSIRALVALIADRMGWRGDVLWDVSQPSGATQYRFSPARAWTTLQWAPTMPLGEGLDRTIAAFYGGRSC